MTNISTNSEGQNFVQGNIPARGRKMSVVLLFLVLVSGGAALYFYRQLSTFKTNPNQSNIEETQAVADKVSKLMFVPTNEQPTLATVSDPAQLKNQPFFAHAKIGDKVLVYPNSGKVILYDPVINKIVEVATINLR
jgi:hypothetical protein